MLLGENSRENQNSGGLGGLYNMVYDGETHLQPLKCLVGED